MSTGRADGTRLDSYHRMALFDKFSIVCGMNDLERDVMRQGLDDLMSKFPTSYKRRREYVAKSIGEMADIMER